MKRLLKVTLWVVVLIALSGLILSFGDVELRPEVRALLDQPAPGFDERDNGYFALLGGIDVDESEDPWDAGRELAMAYQLQLSSGAETLAETGYTAPTRMDLSDDLGELCRVESEPCVATVLADPDTVSRLGAEHAVLLRRYRALYDYSDFSLPLTPSYSQPTPPFGRLADAQRLHTLDCIAKVEQ